MWTSDFYGETGPEHIQSGKGYFETVWHPRGGANFESKFFADATLKVEEVSFRAGGESDEDHQTVGISVYVGQMNGSMTLCGEMDEDKSYNLGEVINIKCKKPVVGQFVSLQRKDVGAMTLAGPIEVFYRKNKEPQYVVEPSGSTFENVKWLALTNAATQIQIKKE